MYYKSIYVFSGNYPGDSVSVELEKDDVELAVQLLKNSYEQIIYVLTANELELDLAIDQFIGIDKNQLYIINFIIQNNILNLEEQIEYQLDDIKEKSLEDGVVEERDIIKNERISIKYGNDIRDLEKLKKLKGLFDITFKNFD